ncbi:MAG: hypothetical protein AMJ62_11905 [Myxococcales bacterium SG8_38]|nr:MAG: hypothetical protein AMJ62_11905 [Myxococcales bacterium SG8_38]
MSNALDAFYRFLDEPIFLWARVGLALLTVFVGLSFTAPMWHIHMKAPQYPEGLDLYIYSYKVDGGNDGNDVQEINTLNHYIGMAPIDRAALTDLDWIPFLFVGMIILSLRTAVIGKVSSMLDLLVLTSYAGAFGFGRLYYKLYTFGHNLDPKAPVTIEPFTPVMWGEKQIANFMTEAGPALGTWYVAAFATGLALLLLAHLLIGRRRYVRQAAA